MKLLNFEGQSVLDSRDVAKMTGKRHSNLMRDIDKYVSDLTDSNLSSLNFFIQSDYTDKKGEIRKCYLLTKQGCEFVANKMTGKKGNLFTAEYVSLFNQMEQERKAIRKPDSYMIDDPIKRAKRWIEERKAYEKLVPKAEYFDSQMRNPGLMTTTEIAKDFGMSAVKLNKYLAKKKVIYRQGAHWVFYQAYSAKGYGQYEAFPYSQKGRQAVHNNLKWTQKGRKFIYDLLAKDHIHPVLEEIDLLEG